MSSSVDQSGPPRARPRLFINGKFYSGALNGVHRVADRLIRELDRQAAETDEPANWDMRLLLPRRAGWAPPLSMIRPVPQRLGHSQLWEQMMLPFAARGGALVSFANLAPAFHPRRATMVHDAQFRLSPESYPPRLRWGYRMLIPRGARGSRLVLTVSDYARDTLAAFGVAAAGMTSVLPNGGDHILAVDADPALLARLRLDAGSYCLAFGSAAHYKNLAVVFAAFAAGPIGGRSLVVVGPSREVLAGAGLSPPPDALFVGAVDDAALRALYEDAHCLLYPSRTEGFGLPPLEAMWCGCPVVAAPAGAMPEIGRDAILYAGLDRPEEWAAAVVALDDPALRRSKIAAGLARAAPYTWRAAGLRLTRLLAPVVEGR